MDTEITPNTISEPRIKPARVDGHNAYYKSGATRVPRHVLHEIEVVLKEHRDKAAKSEKKVGAKTQEIRETTIKNFFSDLFFLKYKITSIHALKQKHLEAVFKFLEANGQSPATLQNKISVMRVFCEWIGKNGMVTDSVHYVEDIQSVRRTMVVQEDKSWEGKGVDIVNNLSLIREKDEVVAIWLELCFAFGFRVQEAVMFRPDIAREGEFVWVREGTKGDRPRVVPIENDVQRDVLKRASSIASKRYGITGQRGKSVKQKLRHFYHVIESCGITLAKHGVTAHGARHQYMQESFEKLFGVKAPIKGGNIAEIDPEKRVLGEGKLMERAGHTRPTIGASYYGSRKPPKSDQKLVEQKIVQ